MVMIRTFHSRLTLSPESAVTLDRYAALWGHAEHDLFAAMAAGADPGKIKPAFSARHGLTSRQFNALSRSVTGKVRSIQELQKLQAQDLQGRIESLEKQLGKMPASNKRHQKARRLGTLQQRLADLKQDRKDGKVRLCFGTRKLFRAQFDLEANGYADHAAWFKDWQAARTDEVFVLGSKDETAGCQGCQIVPLGDQRFSLSLRVPHAVAAGQDTHLALQVTFARGSEAILAALERKLAISYRFLRDGKGWRVFVATEVAGGKALQTDLGALGVDLNEDHLALAETDGDGNLVAVHRVSLITYGCTSEQAKARIGDAIKQVLALALAVRKPLVVEDLEFAKKKRALRESGVRYARMLSSFAYARILDTLKARAFDAGLQVLAINPAYTSLIGKHKFARRYGLSVHGAAAMVIARRAFNFSERPNPTGGHGTSRAPARKRGEHVWSYWGKTLQEQRRLQRTPGRRKTILPATGPAKGHGAGRTPSGGSGGIPARESASGFLAPAEAVSSPVREAYHSDTIICYGF